MTDKLQPSDGIGQNALRKLRKFMKLVDDVPRTDPGVANELYIDEADGNKWKVSTGA